jgi:hypothetical protein
MAQFLDAPNTEFLGSPFGREMNRDITVQIPREPISIVTNAFRT